MRLRIAVPAATLAAFGMWAALTSSALAHPTQTQACTGCHGAGASLTLKATQTSNDGTTARYAVSVSGGSGSKGWAVLNGSTNVTHASSASGSFSMPVGKTYALWAVDTNSGAKSIPVSPVKPATAPAPAPTPAPAPAPTPAPAPVLPPGACRVGIRLLSSAVGIHPLAGDARVILVDTVANTRYSAHANARGFAWMTVPAGTFDLTIKIGGHTRLHRTVQLAGSVYAQTYRLTVPGAPRSFSPGHVSRSVPPEAE